MIVVRLLTALLLLCSQTWAAVLLIPMDLRQTDHLKAYGIAYWILTNRVHVDWLLNYRGGSFACTWFAEAEKECMVRGVYYEIVPEVQYQNILNTISDPEVNQDVIRLEKAPKVAVYSPPNKQPWDDAVTLALTYAEIPFDIVYDDEVLNGKLPLYDWLHLHHEDFTGQFGRFYAAYAHAAWYLQEVKSNEDIAQRWGFQKVSHLKLAIAQKIKEYVAGGGFMFAMCSATDSYDIALSAAGVDICEWMYDGDPADPQAQSKLDYSQCIAFENFVLMRDPLVYEFSNIDVTMSRQVPKAQDYFTLFEFSAKWDPVPTMLCQNHTQVVKGFMGQTTAFRKDLLKPDVLIMGENKAANEARYIHGTLGNGTWTFYGGHDPEDYQHQVGDPPTDLALHPNSPGYRLILNNVLFPAAKKKKQKT